MTRELWQGNQAGTRPRARPPSAQILGSILLIGGLAAATSCSAGGEDDGGGSSGAPKTLVWDQGSWDTDMWN